MGNVTDLYGSDQRTDWAAALTLTVHVDRVDGEGLGICLAEQDSLTQAAFFAGLLEGFSRFDDTLLRGKQLLYLTEALQEQHGADTKAAVANLLREFVAFLEEPLS